MTWEQFSPKHVTCQLKTVRPILVGLTLGLAVATLALPSAAAAATKPPTEIQTTVQSINRLREEANLPLYVPEEKLMKVAQGHAEYMAETTYVSHYGRHESRANDRAVIAGYDAHVSEIIFGGSADLSAVLAWWSESAVYRPLMLSERYHEIGVGLAYATDGRAYWAIVLGEGLAEVGAPTWAVPTAESPVLSGLEGKGLGDLEPAATSLPNSTTLNQLDPLAPLHESKAGESIVSRPPLVTAGTSAGGPEIDPEIAAADGSAVTAAFSPEIPVEPAVRANEPRPALPDDEISGYNTSVLYFAIVLTLILFPTTLFAWQGSRRLSHSHDSV